MFAGCVRRTKTDEQKRRTKTDEKSPVSDAVRLSPSAADILSKRLSRGVLFFFAPQKRGERLNNVKLHLASRFPLIPIKCGKCETMLNF
jgi:hypothetical protein